MTGFILAGLGLAALGLSARWNWWRPKAAGLPILMYHKIGDPPASGDPHARTNSHGYGYGMRLG